jgi:AGZA family xanthine/uracil permease-like MFS transporter
MDEKGSHVGTELRAGLVSFLTMSYILLVNPQIIGQVCVKMMLSCAPTS